MRKIEVFSREKSLAGSWKFGAAALALVATMTLSACAEEDEGGQTSPQDGAAQNGTTMAAGETTGGTTEGTTMGTTAGTTMAGGGTTMMGGGTTMQGGATMGGEITSVQGLIVENPQSLIGREVRISDAQVQDVVDDTTFFIGSDANQTILAALEGERANTQPDSAVVINQGQTVRLIGTVEQLPSPSGLERFGLGQAEIQELDNQQVYLSVTNADVLSQ